MNVFASCRELLDDTDSRVAYYSSAFLLKAWILIDFCVKNVLDPFISPFVILSHFCSE